MRPRAMQRRTRASQRPARALLLLLWPGAGRSRPRASAAAERRLHQDASWEEGEEGVGTRDETRRRREKRKERKKMIFRLSSESSKRLNDLSSAGSSLGASPLSLLLTASSQKRPLSLSMPMPENPFASRRRRQEATTAEVTMSAVEKAKKKKDEDEKFPLLLPSKHATKTRPRPPPMEPATMKETPGRATSKKKLGTRRKDRKSDN